MLLRQALAVVVCVLLSACAAAPPLPQVEPYRPDALRTLHYKAVLAGGDVSIPVFDNATRAMRAKLLAIGTEPAAIQRLSASPVVVAEDGAQAASLSAVLDDIRSLRPGPGQGCLVFATSHGAPGRGLYLAPYREFLAPDELDRALAIGCGNAPTVAIISACYSGAFAAGPMDRANRIVLTASRADRPSFGCSAGRSYTVFDQCLLGAIDHAVTWPGVYAELQSCVADEERRRHFPASQPQAFFGSAVAAMPVAGRAN